MNDSILLKEKKNQIVTLTLNRTEVMNSFNFALLLELKQEIEDLQFSKDVRVIIITGAGKKAFCSGADLKERITLTPVQVRKYIFTIRNLFTKSGKAWLLISGLPRPMPQWALPKPDWQ